MSKDKPADWFDVTVWSNSVGRVKRLLRKGSRVVVTGSLNQERWTTAEGAQRSKVVLNAQNVEVIAKQPKQP